MAQNCSECGEPARLRRVEGCAWKVICACPDFAAYQPQTRATIIVPSRYDDIFEGCKSSINKFAPSEKKVLVRDGDAIVPPEGWTTIQGPSEKFCYSRNVNLGAKSAPPGSDIFLCNDDVLFKHKGTLEIMQNVMNRYPDVGILSPLIIGQVGHYDQGHIAETQTIQYTECRLCFVAVLIRREVWDKIGGLDERIGANGSYGWDDCDACRRVVNAGYKLATTGRAKVQHGHIDGKWSTSFRRESSTMDQMDKIASKQYFDIWGDNDLGCYGKEPNKFLAAL